MDRMTEQNSRFSAAVLAGGKSTRMGRDKAALSFDGSTLLEHQVRKLYRLGTEDIMISGSCLEVPGTRFVPDIWPHLGPLSGIHACLLAAKCQAVLFISVDTPLVPPEVLQELLNAHAGGVTLLSHDEHIEPLLGVYDTALADLCETILHSGHTGVRRLLDQVQVCLVPYEKDPGIFLNCNTPEEYQKVLQAPRCDHILTESEAGKNSEAVYKKTEKR